jgi:hypothetical protein
VLRSLSAAMAQAPEPPGVDTKASKTWNSDDAEVEKIFKPRTDDWNRAYYYRR